MKNSKSALTKKLAFAAVMAGLSVVLLWLGSLSVLDLSSVVVCALLTMVLVVEAGARYAWLTTAVTTVLGLLLLPDKLLAVIYLFLGGMYPILKAWLEKYPYWLSWVFKISTMDTMLLLTIAASKLLFTTGEPFFDFTWVVILAGSVFFVIYDLALSTFVTLYINKLRRRLGLKKLF